MLRDIQVLVRGLEARGKEVERVREENEQWVLCKIKQFEALDQEMKGKDRLIGKLKHKLGRMRDSSEAVRNE